MRSSVLFFIAALIFPVYSQACSTTQKEVLRQNLRFHPIAGETTSHWPAQQTIVIGSIASFLVPLDTNIELHDIERGSVAPLTVFGEPSHEQIRASHNIVPRWVDIEHDPKTYKWVHILASSYGAGEVRMSSANGWSRQIKFSMVYPSQLDSAARPPVELALGESTTPSVRVDGRDNIEVIVPGSVADGWRVSPASATGFNLIRVQRVEKTSGEPQVKLFFAGTSNPRNATMAVLRGSGESAKTFQFEIVALPTAAC